MKNVKNYQKKVSKLLLKQLGVIYILMIVLVVMLTIILSVNIRILRLKGVCVGGFFDLQILSSSNPVAQIRVF